MSDYLTFINEDGFTLIKGDRQVRKRKAERSSQLNLSPGASSASPSNTPARPKPFNFKNTIPAILSDIEPKFNSKVKLMSKLKQFHPNIKVPKVLERKNNSFLIIGGTPRVIGILQSESKMKACLGKKVKISLPKAYQTAKPKRSLVAKGVPAEVTEQEFKGFLDVNKINYAKAGRLTSKKDGGGVLEMFKLEIKDDTEAEALITENLTCPITGIMFWMKEFHTPISVQQCWTCQVSDIWPKLVGPKPNALSVGRVIIIKDAQIKRKNSQNTPTVKDHMLHPTNGVQHTKTGISGNMWWTAKNRVPQFYAKTRFPHIPRIRLSHFQPKDLQNS